MSRFHRDLQLGSAETVLAGVTGKDGDGEKRGLRTTDRTGHLHACVNITAAPLERANSRAAGLYDASCARVADMSLGVRYGAGVADSGDPYNPLDRVELGKSVERALLARPLVELQNFLVRRPEKFPGAGLYALYYVGSLPYYSSIAPPEQEPGETPIYVGRARPKGARQGSLGLQSTTTDPQLYDRLHEHGLSIAAVEEYGNQVGELTLTVADFLCRYLVADEIWVPMGEALLIGHYRPVWNVVVDGFGNHGPGGGREHQAKSSWDTLHPGRKWTFRLPPATGDTAEIRSLMADHFGVMARPDLAASPVFDDAVMRALAEEADEEPG